MGQVAKQRMTLYKDGMLSHYNHGPIMEEGVLATKCCFFAKELMQLS